MPTAPRDTKDQAAHRHHPPSALPAMQSPSPASAPHRDQPTPPALQQAAEDNELVDSPDDSAPSKLDACLRTPRLWPWASAQPVFQTVDGDKPLRSRKLVYRS